MAFQNFPKSPSAVGLLVLITVSCFLFRKNVRGHFEAQIRLISPQPHGNWSLGATQLLGNDTKTILVWNEYFGSSYYGLGPGRAGFEKFNCAVSTCDLTTDRTRFQEADAVIFHVFNFRVSQMPTRTRPDQIWIYMNMENPFRSYQYLTGMDDMFNLTFTYYNDSSTDIVVPFGRHARSEPYRLQPLDFYRNKSKMAAWVVSDCIVHSTRSEYVKELSKYIDVDIYGACGNLTCPRSPTAAKRECFRQISTDYFFYISFENGYCLDYVTEKILRPLGMELVPLVLGRVDYSNQFPDNSYINVKDYASPKDLAEYLKYLTANIDEYMKHLEWKETYPYYYRLTTGRSEGFCRLCEILHDKSYNFKTNFSVSDYWDPSRHCLAGDAERKAVHLL